LRATLRGSSICNEPTGLFESTEVPLNFTGLSHIVKADFSSTDLSLIRSSILFPNSAPNFQPHLPTWTQLAPGYDPSTTHWNNACMSVVSWPDCYNAQSTPAVSCPVASMGRMHSIAPIPSRWSASDEIELSGPGVGNLGSGTQNSIGSMEDRNNVLQEK
jgi:hypothetical protein